MEGKTCPPSVCVPKNQQTEVLYNTKSKTPEKKTAPFQASAVELIAALLSYPLAYYYVNNYMFPTEFHRWAVVIFTLLFCLSVECFCRGFGLRKIPPESKFWVGCMVTVALAQSLWSGATTMLWSPLILHVMAAYWVLCRTGCLIDHRSGPMFVLDVLSAMVLTPFRHFFLRIRTIWYALTHRIFRKDAGKKTLVVLVTLLIMLPLLFFAVNQLRQADAGFDAIVRQITFAMDRFVLSSRGWSFFWSLFVGAYLYGLVGGSLRAGEKANLSSQADAAKSCAEHLRLVPELTFTLSLGLFCLVYLVFFSLQVGYLAGAFRGVLPQNFTVAEFARTGFWQLCTVVVLNFALLFGAAKFCRSTLQNSKSLKIMALALLGCNLLFAVVALCKIGVYVAMYGFTPRRVLASWFMLVLVAFSVLAIIAMVRPIPAARIAVLLAASMFALLCIGNPDWFIIRGNLYLYRTGIIQQLDTDVLQECGAAKDLEAYRRTLYNVGWIEGKSLGELCYEFGEPDEQRGSYVYWNVGWNVIDPEILTVRLERKHPVEPWTAAEAVITEGYVGSDENNG